ncbi:MAG TPA: NUDIX domain-containing protein [Phycisphaerales bacterium]|nr:NUDIX domain-containing protein [Phycisphaerales bacterium]HMP37120.1 NUDIX domain-containing protein [Phycisphaerales bacterium]
MSQPVSNIVHLRRPAVIRMVEEPFVPASSVIGRAERTWRRLRAENPACFDGRLLHVLGLSRNGHGGATIHAAECAYRWHAAALAGVPTGVRPLGVKGVLIADGAVLLGRRSAAVAGHPGCWEFAPGGGVPPGTPPELQLRRELCEETGIDGAGASAVPRALFLDRSVLTWELVFTLRLPRRVAATAVDGEYEELRWTPIDALPSVTGDRVTPAASAIAALVRRWTDLPATVSSSAAR